MNVLEALRLLVGLPAVLLLPGWAWSLAFWPAWGPRARPARALEAAGPDVARQGLLERAVVSLALSIALVPLAALAWSA
ncbi:MAG: hypothetical protein QOC71_189, partial [Thermoplasmata archaeon]|nr:hypothetical protein [Thermoplasmata archaeon]